MISAASRTKWKYRVLKGTWTGLLLMYGGGGQGDLPGGRVRIQRCPDAGMAGRSEGWRRAAHEKVLGRGEQSAEALWQEKASV